MPTTANSPAPAHLLDLTRTVSRAGARATGVDRVERGYIAHLAACETPLFGLVRTRLGFLLLDREGCLKLQAHCETPVWSGSDILSRLTRRRESDRGVAESGMRKLALGRCVPSRLGRLLSTHLPAGSVYFNVGQTNLNDAVIHGVKAANMRLVPYVHDTIPLDWPQTQTSKARHRFRLFVTQVERHAELVLCNSEDTRTHLLRHAPSLDPDKIHVIHPGLPEMRIGTAPKGPWSDHPCFVAVGTIEPRKNIGFLLDLWEGLEKPDDPKLILCGRRGWMCDEVMDRIGRGMPNVYHLPDLPDPELWALMASSAGLLFPSVAEGFGYPAVEAARLGIPIICSRLDSVHEVLGEYPIYASVSDRYRWLNKVEQLAQRRRVRSGEQKRPEISEGPLWGNHFNKLFTIL